MIKFYDVALSPYAQKVKIALLEKSLTFETVAVALGEDTAFSAVNPRGEVPALVDGDLAIFDSSIILEYLEDAYPDHPLLPADAAARARVRMLEEVCDTQFEAVNWGLNEIVGFKRAEGELAQHMLVQAAADLERIKSWLEKQISPAGWFNGDEFGFGDIVAFPYVQTASLFKQGPAEGSKLSDWHARMLDRPSVQTTLAEAKAALPRFRELGAKFVSGEVPRQFRDHRLEFMLRAGGLEVVAQGLETQSIRFSTLPD